MMLRAELLAPGRLELREVLVPEPGPGELLVRVDVALTCGTDLKMYRRGHPRLPMPAPFGHEFAGTVAAVGSGVTRFREGDPVACVPTAPCDSCRLCRNGRENLCPAAVGRIALGAFAEFILLPPHIVLEHVFPRAAGLDAETAAALEPLSSVVHGASRVNLAGATVVLLGDGPIAMLFVQLARLRGAERLLVAGRHEERLRVASELGAGTTTLSSSALEEHVRELMGGADVVIECVGTPDTWEQAPALAAPGAEVLLYGGCAAGTRATFDTYRVHYDEIDLKGAFHYTRADVRHALGLLEDGLINVHALVTHRRSLAELDEALGLALRRDAMKVAVTNGPGLGLGNSQQS